MTRVSNETRLALLQAEVVDLSEKVETLTISVQSLAEVHNALRFLVKFAMGVSAIIATVAGVWSAWRAP